MTKKSEVDTTLAPTKRRSLFKDFRVVVHVNRETGEDGCVATGIVAHEGDAVVSISYWMGNDPNFEVTGDITVDKNTGIINFSTQENDYTVRELREEDGIWLSRYKTSLPVSAIRQNLKRIMEKDPMAEDASTPDDLLFAATFVGDDVVVGLVYDNGDGRYSRIDGDWVLMSDVDPTFEDIIVTPINPELADEFVELYDKQTLTLPKIKPFEITE